MTVQQYTLNPKHPKPRRVFLGRRLRLLQYADNGKNVQGSRDSNLRRGLCFPVLGFGVKGLALAPPG